MNLDGKVVGIAIARADLPGRPREFGHAVPASMARKIASDLADLGRVRRGYLGLRIDREETADPQSGGGRLFIAGVMPGGPAVAAGFQMGDRIEALDGRPVADVETFSRAIMDAPVGQEFKVTIERGGVTREIRVKSRQLPGPGSAPADSRPVRPGTPRRAPARDRARGERPRQAPAPPRQSAPLRSEPSDVGPSPPAGGDNAKPAPGPRTKANPPKPAPEVENDPAPDLPPALDPPPAPPTANEPAPKKK